VDGIKSATGLDVAVYGNTTRSATTFIAADGKSRFIGVKEENDHIKKTVLDQGAVYVGGVDILNTAYFTAFAPLIDSDKNPIGMLFVGVEQSSVFQTAARSIQITFVFSIGVLFVLFIFSYLLGRYIRYQTR
jgi:methyl-accepting chemotaxis protein